MSLFLFVQLGSHGKRECSHQCFQSLSTVPKRLGTALGLSQPRLQSQCFRTRVGGFVADSGLGTDGVLVLLDPTQSLLPVNSALYQQEYREQVLGPLYCLSWQAGSLAGLMPSSFPRVAS